MSLLTDASLVLTPNANKTSKLYSIIPTDGNGDFTTTRATTATRVNESGLIEVTGINMQRRDYSLGSCPNLLIEPQRTNLALRSEEFENASWIKAGVTIDSNTAVSPSGIQNADRLTELAVNDYHRIFSSAITIVSGSNYSFSVYVRKDTQRYIRLIINNSSIPTAWVGAQFDLDSLTFTNNTGLTSGTFLSASIENANNGWYRCTIVGSVVATAVIGLIAFSNGNPILNTDQRGSSVYIGNVANKLDFWGAQVESGAYATSYIPTTNATVTRNADSISLANVRTNNLITSSGGTWFVELRNNVPLIRSSFDGGLFLGSTSSISTGNNFSIRNILGTSSRLFITKIINGVRTDLYTTLTDTVKIAIKWNGVTADVFVNGVKVVSATAFTETALQFLADNGQSVPRNINQMALFPTPLTDTQCIQLTTL